MTTISKKGLLGYTVSCDLCGGAFLITPSLKDAKQRKQAHETELHKKVRRTRLPTGDSNESETI